MRHFPRSWRARVIGKLNQPVNLKKKMHLSHKHTYQAHEHQQLFSARVATLFYNGCVWNEFVWRVLQPRTVWSRERLTPASSSPALNGTLWHTKVKRPTLPIGYVCNVMKTTTMWPARPSAGRATTNSGTTTATPPARRSARTAGMVQTVMLVSSNFLNIFIFLINYFYLCSFFKLCQITFRFSNCF